MIRSILIEGIDRLGKDTLIKGLMDRYGFFQVVHFQKPQLLDRYVREVINNNSSDQVYVQEAVHREALKMYQAESFASMFMMMASPVRFIFNRAHLGETVYGPRYRGYDSSYVFNLEEAFAHPGGPLETSLLVLLHTSNFNFISDDGQSFDASKREEEQADFIAAFEKSKIKNKLMIDVHDGSSGFLHKTTVLEAVARQLD